MRILVTGQCTVHWGRLEFGNIGNYYITETTFRELHRVFPNAEIVTTFQMTEEFSQREKVKCLPMSLFYNWEDDDVKNALHEYGIAQYYNETGFLIEQTPFIREVTQSDLIVDFSGELWGDHAEPVGKNRFLVGLLKNRTAQLLGKKTVLLAGSQGPFSHISTKEFAKTVFKNFDLILNRESASIELLIENDFDVTKVQNFTDPAFLFEPYSDDKMVKIYEEENLTNKSKPIVGFILCGFNMLKGPYDKWPRKDEEFGQFVLAVEHIVNKLKAKVIIFSHQNGFELPPNFKLINGRDYPYAKRLQELVISKGNVNKDDVRCLDKPYLPKELKAIIKQFDMLVTGRIHGFVAGVSQLVPSVIINRGHGPASKRNVGFARSVGFEHLMANPGRADDIIAKIDECWYNRNSYKVILEERIPLVQKQAHELYDTLTKLF